MKPNAAQIHVYAHTHHKFRGSLVTSLEIEKKIILCISLSLDYGHMLQAYTFQVT
jgi:hypothetical protein